MHRMHNQPRLKHGPETSGSMIHWAGEYDIFTRLMGMGVNARNSRIVIELAHIKPGDRVLDVACGTGNLTLTAESYTGPTGKVHGIDASPEMIELAQKKAARAKAGVIFEVGLAEQLAFPDAMFDVVISRLAIHHLPDDLKSKAFAEMLRVLKPGGSVLIADFIQPSNHILGHITTHLLGPKMVKTSAWSLPPMLEAAGFSEVTAGPTQFFALGFVRGKKPER